MNCPECKGSGLPTRKHSDLADKCEDCKGTGLIEEPKSILATLTKVQIDRILNSEEHQAKKWKKLVKERDRLKEALEHIANQFAPACCDRDDGETLARHYEDLANEALKK